MYGQYVLDRLRHRAVREENERVALARRIGLHGEEHLHKLGPVGDEVLVLPVDRVHREDGILAHVRVPVFEARTARRDERLEQLRVFGDLLEEAEGCTTDVLIGVLLKLYQTDARRTRHETHTRSLQMALLNAVDLKKQYTIGHRLTR